MEFDIRYQEYTFKHSFSEHPDTSQDRFQEHYHTSYELLYFVSGDADFHLQDMLYKIKPGSLLIAKPGEYHNIVFHSASPYDRYVIRFSPLAIPSFMIRQLEKTRSVYYIQGTPLAEEFVRMDKHMQYLHPDTRVFACIGSITLILSYLISSSELIQQADYINEDSKRILMYIESHLNEIHSVEELSGALHMSRSTIYRLFSRQLNTSLMAYIRTQKCLLARTLLAEGASATEVASRLGFNHYSSFYRDYVKIFHESPAANRSL